jgi:dihydrofolate synthase / folylpolyglutamate synthase
MRFIRVKTRKFLPPKDKLFQLLDKYLPKLYEGDIVFITSKILAIHQGRCVLISDQVSKQNLISKEADLIMPRYESRGVGYTLTIKNYTLIASAGIDESNANGYYILWPNHPEKSAQQICQYLKKKNKLKKIAIIITDSHITPLHAGTTGVAIGFFGLKPLRDYRKKPDIFGRKLKVTRSNLVDGLAAGAVMCMGEGKEQTPIAIARGFKDIKFTNKKTFKDFVIDPKEDLYFPLLKNFKKPSTRG